jgi:N-acetylglucosaminyl-diphospho-decaprenol L-rhamnosyltransferase
MAAPALSVVVPTRDTAALTLACLGSLARAGGPAREVILVDDGSTDGTAARVGQAFPETRILRHETSRGFTVSANAGLAAARGDVLLLLNSDTQIAGGGLDALARALDDDATLGIAGAQLVDPDGTPQWSGGRLPGALWLFAEASGAVKLLARLPGFRRVRPLDAAGDRDVDWVCGTALAMRRAIWAALGPLDEGFRLYGQDLDFCARARRAGWRVRVLRGFNAVHHGGVTVRQVTGSTARQHAPLLWTDLRRFTGKTYGPAAARAATCALGAGGVLRLAGRAVLAPMVRGARRATWRGESAELRAALAALRGPVA